MLYLFPGRTKRSNTADCPVLPSTLRPVSSSLEPWTVEEERAVGLGSQHIAERLRQVPIHACRYTAQNDCLHVYEGSNLWRSWYSHIQLGKAVKHLQPYGKSPNECDMDSPTFCFLNCQVSFCQPIFPFSLILFSKNYTHDPAQKLVFCFPPTLVDSTEGMSAGGFGTLLGIEQTLGEYNVTISFLRLITTLVKGQLGSTQSQGLVPCIMFVLREMLPNYHRWRYNSHGVRENLGYLMLNLIHAILNLCPDTDQRSSSPSLQTLCIYTLTNTEAGQAIINIMGIGVDTINQVMASQSGSSGTEGQGQMLMQTVKLAFSITNNVAPMSVYACLGSDAAAIRDAFLNRLECSIEDMQIKVMTLEFLTVAVETQPGLIELFLNLDVKNKSDGTKEYSLGQWSCLQVVLDLIDLKKSDRFWCTPQLHRSAIAFLHALWQDRRDSAMSVLRTKPHFWENLTGPVFGTLVSPSDSSDLSVLETCAFIMRILCLEIYYVVRGSLDNSLKSILAKFSKEGRFTYWSNYVHSLVLRVAEMEGSCSSLTEYHMLLSAWRILLIISTHFEDVMHLTDTKVRQQLFQDILDGAEHLTLIRIRNLAGRRKRGGDGRAPPPEPYQATCSQHGEGALGWPPKAPCPHVDGDKGLNPTTLA
ncbi:hypothetical protein AB205_0080430 [Aquarana catesbeiana]|uniref:Nucleoporin Nup188 N-terminal subdomain III domain-containing protein n=1 Tax=Aquarana catesbeiana TaxID=8400 RepID=A0A2G9SHM1_AQUCT|nr:hypothetical protein AB205_0080430 [Aquarana catesbeiana]